MTAPRAKRAVAASVHLYWWLLTVYPRDFRREYGPHMTQVFRDRCLDVVQDRGVAGLMPLWMAMAKDVAASAWVQRQSDWRASVERKSIIAISVGTTFLAVPSLFVAVNILQYVVGINLPWNPFDAIYEGTGHTPLSYFFDGVIVFGPVAALAAYLLSLTNITLSWREDRLLTVVVHKGSGLALVLIGVCLLVLGIMAAYLVAENLPCILGQQTAC